MIALDELQKVDLRVGKIMTAERVPGSEKLLKLSVELGEAAPRQVISGIAQWYAPEVLVGRQVVMAANLEPRTIMDLESQGMLLAAHREDGSAVLLTALEEVPSGAKIT
jgi:methionyl-tRNA synthetase